MTTDEVSHLLMWAYKQGFTDAIEVVNAAAEGAMLGLDHNSGKMESDAK